ncbi:MAG: Type 1 glutamine amidotransferase-like domain-containing protein [Actinomycetota bacterium]
MAKGKGALALVGGGEWTTPCRSLDERLLTRSGGREVVVLPTAAAFEHPERAVARAAEWFGGLGATVRGLDLLTRRDAEDADLVAQLRAARFVYLADGSPLHLRSVLKGSPCFDAIVHAYERGAVVAASGAAATLLCDPMVDPRGGAFTVGLGLVTGLAVFPYHGTTAEHIRERSLALLAPDAVLVGIDEGSAIVRDGEGAWEAFGDGVTVYRRDAAARNPVPGTAIV